MRKKGFLPSTVTIILSVGVYYIWAVVMQKNDTVGIVLGIITAVLVSAFFARLKKGEQ